MNPDEAQPATPSDPSAEPVHGHRAVASLVPFGLGQPKAHDYRTLAAALWESRDRLGQAARILTLGVCDGCALGPRGLRDDVSDGLHLCATRLRQLRRHTMPALAPADLLDMGRLRRMDAAALLGLGRISQPYVYARGDRGFRRASWDEATTLLGEAAAPLPPERLGFLAGPAASDEATYTLAKAARLLGTNNLGLCAPVRGATRLDALEATLGCAASTCSVSDLVGADLVLLLGADLVRDQPDIARTLAEAKRRGTRVVVLGPTLEPELEATWVPSEPSSALFGTRLMDDHVPIRPGGEAAFLSGVLKGVEEAGAIDPTFIGRATLGWERTREQLRALSWEALEGAAGASRREMVWVSELCARARSGVSVYAMASADAAPADATLRALANLHLARGLLGQPKCGILPLRGSFNEGADALGMGPRHLPGPIALDGAAAAALAQTWGFPVPATPGHGAAGMLEAARQRELALLYVMGGDLGRAVPETERLEAALGQVQVRVHQDTVLTPASLVEPGALLVLLPEQSRYEQRGGATITSAERRVRFSPELADAPAPELCRPAWEIPCLFAMACKPALANALTYTGAAGIRAEIAAVVPRYAGIERLGQAGDWVQWGGPQLYADGDFSAMPEGRACFSALPLPASAAEPGRR